MQATKAHSMHTEVILVTPEQAAEWLTKNIGNRRLRNDVVEKYRRIMKAGNWRLTPQGIVFDDTGALATGQHRLTAVVRAGVSVPMTVTWGLPREYRSALDQGSQWDAADTIRNIDGCDWIDRRHVAMIRCMMGNYGKNKRNFSADEVAEYAIKNEGIIRQALTLDSGHGALSAPPMYACYAGAMLKEDFSKLERFASIMRFPENVATNEGAALRLRDFLIMTPNPWGGATRTPSMLKAQRALYAFCQGQPLAKLYSNDRVYYPAPPVAVYED